MRDLDAIKREIRDRVPLVDVVSQHVALKQRGDRYTGLCPFHQEKTPSFTVHALRGFFKCFGCGRGGDVFTFVQHMENVSFPEALRMLADRAGITLRRGPGRVSEGPDRADLAKVNEWACAFFREELLKTQAGAAARAYVRRRGILPETEATFELGFAAGNVEVLTERARRAGFSTTVLLAADVLRESESGRVYAAFQDRLMFPIRDAMNRVVGFGGRTLVDHKAKYLNTRQTELFEKGHGLYALAQARQRMTEAGRAVVTEGYVDAIMAHQAGFGETVAALGTALTEAQVDLLRRYASSAIFLFDSDRAGEAAADRAIEVALPRRLTVRLANITDGKDPADFLQAHDPKEFEAILNSSTDALEFKWQRLNRSFNGGDLKGRHEAVTHFVGVVAKACASDALDVIGRGLVVNQVAGLLSLDPREVHRLMSRLQRRAESPASASRADVAAVERQARSADGGEAAALVLLGVVLSDGGYCADAGDVLRCAPFGSAMDRGLAGVALELFDAYGEFDLGEVLARCEEPAMAQRAIDLAEEAQRRGNPAASVHAALSRWDDAQRERQLSGLRGNIVEAISRPPSEDDDAAQAAAHEYLDGLTKARHFAPRRFRGRISGDLPPRNEGEAAVSQSPVES